MLLYQCRKLTPQDLVVVQPTSISGGTDIGYLGDDFRLFFLHFFVLSLFDDYLYQYFLINR